MWCQLTLCRNEKGLDWGHLMCVELHEWFIVDGCQELNWAALLGTVMQYSPPWGQHQRLGKSCNRPANISQKWQGLRLALRTIRCSEWASDESLESSGNKRGSWVDWHAKAKRLSRFLPGLFITVSLSFLYINTNEFYWAQDWEKSLLRWGVQGC